VNNRIAVEIIDGGHAAILELFLGCDADVGDRGPPETARPKPGTLAGAGQGSLCYMVTMYCVANPCCVAKIKEWAF
jgi:hypothetical protein